MAPAPKKKTVAKAVAKAPAKKSAPAKAPVKAAKTESGAISLTVRGKANPLVSIGIPAYNRPKDLARTLDSLLAQTYPHWEAHISDNGSPNPDVEKIGNEYAKKDSRIHYHRVPENRRMSFNFFNSASKANKGDYFLWVSDDDVWFPTLLEENLKLMQQHPDAELTGHGFYLTNLEEDIIGDNGDYRRYNQSAPSWKNRLFFLWEPEVYGKANCFYGMYTRKLINEILPLWPACDIEGWAGDYIFAYAARTRVPMYYTKTNLILKEQRTHIKEWRAKTPVYQSFDFYGFARWSHYTARYIRVANGPLDKAFVAAVMTARLIYKAVYALPLKIINKLRGERGVHFTKWRYPHYVHKGE